MRTQTYLFFLFLCVLLMATAVLALALGTVSFSLADMIRLFTGNASDPVSASIFFQLRLPRVVLALVTGAGLAASGCVFQALLRNPLADSYTLGVSSGAALGATVGIVTGAALLHPLALPMCAFAGTCACIFLVYRLAEAHRFSDHGLILSGVMLGFICSALVLLTIALSNAEQLYSTLVWLTGDLSTVNIPVLITALALTAAGTAALLVCAGELDILTLGEEKAAHLGVNPELMRKLLFLIASLITAACVSAAGVVGFVGLMIPHAMRRFTGSRARPLIIASTIAGAAFLALCDTFARTVITPLELPVGVITGLAGGTVFIFLLMKRAPGRPS